MQHKALPDNHLQPSITTIWERGRRLESILRIHLGENEAAKYNPD